MKLTLKHAAALVNLRGNTDFDVFVQLLAEYEAEMTDRMIMQTDHASISRTQGGVVVLRDIRHFITSAAELLNKTPR